MLRIAICDDQPRELEVINEYITEYLDTHTLEAEIKEFSHPDQLLTAIETESFHIYILDIVMPMVSGLDLGQSIRPYQPGGSDRLYHHRAGLYILIQPPMTAPANSIILSALPLPFDGSLTAYAWSMDYLLSKIRNSIAKVNLSITANGSVEISRPIFKNS